MSDTPNFSDVAGEAFDKATGVETPATTTPEPLKVDESTETSVETVKPEVQAEEQQPEESFSTFNPNELTPEMQAVYKRWQGDYTRTRQAEKAHIKELEEKLSKFEKQPQGTSQTEINNSYETGIQNGQIDPKMSLADYTKLVKEQTKSEIREEIKTEQENTYIESQEREFFNLDTRFSEGPGQDKILLNYVAGELGAMRDKYESEHGNVLGFDFIGNAKQLISEYDGRITQANKAFVAKQSEQAKANATKSSKAMPKTSNSAGSPSGKATLEEAFNVAWDKANN